MGRLLLIPLPLLLAGYVLLSAYQTEPVGVSPALAAVLTAQPTTSGCDAQPALSYTIPTVIAGPNSQANVNCLAWQDFIAVNWQASPAACTSDTAIPAAKFGQPNNTAPVVWETYKEASDVFQKEAAVPSPWCSGGSLAHANKYLGIARYSRNCIWRHGAHQDSLLVQ